mgnify:CR=1 FL=1
MTSQEIKALTGQYIMNTYGRFPVAIDHGQGATLYDPEGNAYIDFTSGIGVTDLGYGNTAWADSIAAQAKKLGHVSNLFYTEPAARLAEINDLRRRAADPLRLLGAESHAAATAEAQAMALADFLERLHLAQRLDTLAEDLRREGRGALAAEYAQLWELSLIHI